MQKHYQRFRPKAYRDPDESGRLEAFEAWLLLRVAQAVDDGDVPEPLLTELQSEIEASKERPQQAGHAAAIQQIADLAGVDPEKAAEVLATMEAQPTVTRQLLMRRIAEKWLEGQRETGEI